MAQTKQRQGFGNTVDLPRKLEILGIGDLQEPRGQRRVGADQLRDLLQIGLGALQLKQQQRHHAGDAGQVELPFKQLLQDHVSKISRCLTTVRAAIEPG